jgi:ATP-dependent RNA helicase DOB1
MNIPDEATIREYYDLRQQIEGYTAEMRDKITLPDHCLPYLQPGRLVHIKHQDFDFGWGVLVNYNKRRVPKNATEEYPPQESYVVDVLIPVAEQSSAGPLQGEELLPPGVRPPQKGEKSRLEVVPAVLRCIHAIALVRTHLPKDLKPLEAKKSVSRHVAEIQKRFPDGLALLDPVEHMNITDDEFKRTLRVC